MSSRKNSKTSIMAKTSESLRQIVISRVGRTRRPAHDYLDHASEVVVLGSMAIGLDGPNSDIDVLCIGGHECRVKTHAVDLIVISRETAANPLWLQSELASHVGKYGFWVKGTPQWRDRTHIGRQAVDEKRRRVSAFMKHLPESWSGLDEGFRNKYSVKFRREAQRLRLLERDIPIPP